MQAVDNSLSRPVNIEHEKRWWLVSMSYDERTELYANGDFPPEW